MKHLLPWTHTSENITTPTQCYSIYSECVYRMYAERHICYKKRSYLCRFYHLSISVTQFRILSIPQWSAQRQITRAACCSDRKALCSDPLQALWQTRTEISRKIIEVRGRFPKAARTGHLSWCRMVHTPPLSPQVRSEAQIVFSEAFPGHLQPGPQW